MPVAAAAVGADPKETGIRAGPGASPPTQSLSAGFGALFAMVLGRPLSDQSGDGGHQGAPAPSGQPGRHHPDDSDAAATELAAAAQLVLPGVQAPVAQPLPPTPTAAAAATPAQSPVVAIRQAPGSPWLPAGDPAAGLRPVPIPAAGAPLAETAVNSLQAQLPVQAPAAAPPDIQTPVAGPTAVAPTDATPASAARSPVQSAGFPSMATDQRAASLRQQTPPDPGAPLAATARPTAPPADQQPSADSLAAQRPAPAAASPATTPVPSGAVPLLPATGVTPSQQPQQAQAPATPSSLPPLVAPAAALQPASEPVQAPVAELRAGQTPAPVPLPTGDPRPDIQAQAALPAAAQSSRRFAPQAEPAPEPVKPTASPVAKATSAGSDQPVATDPKTPPHPAPSVPAPPTSPHPAVTPTVHQPATAQAEAAPSPAPAPPQPADRMLPAALPARVMQWIHTGQGSGQIQVRLDPEHLGTMLIHLSVEKGQVHATALVSTSEARQALEANLDHLRHDLAGQGLSLSGFSVTVDSGTGSGGQGAQPEPAWWQHYRATGARAAEPAARPAPQPRFSSGRLDIRA